MPGTNPAYLEAARDLARAMHAANATLVYGGGTVGLMGEVASTLVSLSGPSAVHGIIPEALIKYEQAGRGGTMVASDSALPKSQVYGRTTVVKDMHSRKRLMADEVIAGGAGSGFVALPGGYGTLEELAEVTTWNQLGIHARPVCLLNTEGYWEGLIQWVKKSVADGFVSEKNSGIITVASKPAEVLPLLQSYKVAGGRFDLNWDTMSPTEEKKSDLA